MIDFDRLFAAATGRFALGEYSIHGPTHWRRVERNGVRLAESCGVNPVPVRVFALLHDSCRENEMHDPEHGPRAADFARTLRKSHLESIEDSVFEQVCVAMTGHDRGKVTDDFLIGCCWDADRLDLGRVGITPDARFMSTPLGRSLCANRR